MEKKNNETGNRRTKKKKKLIRFLTINEIENKGSSIKQTT